MKILSLLAEILFVFFVASSITGCGLVVARHAKSEAASITIEDQPNAWGNLYRYVIWNGESYGPKAFVTIAHNDGVKKIELVQGGAVQIQCAIALGLAMQADVVAGPGVSGGARQLIANGPISMDACKIPVHIPHSKLAMGEYYVKVVNRQAFLEGDKPMDFNVFSDYLVSIGAKAIVMRDPTIADAWCLSAIAAHAGIQLLEVEPNGTIQAQQIAGVGSIKQGCSQE